MNTNTAEGVLLGLACGDAVGRPVEFDSPDEIDAKHGTLTDMVGNGIWGQPAGTVTDDTEQALCIAESLVECGTFDPADIADRFLEWYATDPFDIGLMTRQSFEALENGYSWDVAGQRVWERRPEGSNAGNGSVMRCPPLAVAYHDATDTEKLVDTSRRSSQITHADPRCTYGCAVLNLTIAGILRDESDPLSAALNHLGSDAPDELVAALRPIAEGETPESLSTSGYVVHSLQTALHDGLTTTSAAEAIITAVNRGGDTDTIGAIAGAVAGARYGADDLPDEWLGTLQKRDRLAQLARELSS